jgi:hypothetical protein
MILKSWFSPAFNVSFRRSLTLIDRLKTPVFMIVGARGAYNLCDVCILRRHMLLMVVVE